MKLTLHLQAGIQAGIPGQGETTASVSGDVLTVNGKDYDLSAVPEGGTATPEGEDHPFVGPITRPSTSIHAAIVWRYDPATAEPNQGTEHPVITKLSGEVADPVIRKPEPEDEE